MRLSILFILLMPALANAQSVRGVVTGAGAALPGATVVIQGTGGGTVTAADGFYQLADLPAGEVILEFRSLGYKSRIVEVELAAKEEQVVHINLEESNLGLDEVVITGTMQPTFVSASPIKVDVVTSRHLNIFTPAAASSIVEGIKLVNGVQEVVACGVCFTNSISINGLPGPYTAILMDGTPIYGNLASVYGLNGIPSMIIDRFEVIKGPNSTLYGSEAVAGVINIITKKPEDQPTLMADVMVTSHMENFGNMAAAPSIGNSHGYIGLNYALINDFDDENGDGFGDNVNLDRYSIFTKWNIHRKSERPFSVAAKLYYEDRRNGVEEFIKNRNYRTLRGNDSIYGESIYTHRAEVFGSYEINDRLQADYSLSRHEQDSYYGSDFYAATQTIFFTNLIWNQRLKAHALLGGLTMRYQNYDDNTVATARQGDQQFIPGVFLQDEWRVTEGWTLLTGARLDHYERHGIIFSPRLNTKLKVADWTTFRLNLGTGFRVVNLFTEDHAFVTGQRTVDITEELKPERSYNAAMNINHLYTLGQSQGMLDIDIYYTYFTNKIIPDYSDTDKIIYANTDGHAITRGIGININHDFTLPLAINAGITLQRATQTEKNTDGELITSAIEFAPRWSGLFTANYELKKINLSLAYTLRVTGPMALPEVYDLGNDGMPVGTPRPTKSQTFAFHNIQLAHQFSKALTVYAGVQNLLNYVQSISPLVGYNDPNTSTGFSEFFDTSYAFAPIHGRELYLGVKWNLD